MPQLARRRLLSATVLVAGGLGCGSTAHVAGASRSIGGPAVVDDAGGGEPPAPIDSGDNTSIVACFGPPTGTVAPECGASCGNGVIDACPQCGPQPGGPGSGASSSGGATTSGTMSCSAVDPYRVKELCDGTNLGGATCASIGFTGGVLSCASSCDFDTSACASCASGPSITACSTRVLTDLGAGAAGPWSIAAAATDNEVLLAWTEAEPTNNGGAGADGNAVHLARFRASDLSVLWLSNCLFPGASEVTLARSTTGYVLAYMTTIATATTSQTQVAVQALDASGFATGAPQTTIAGAEEALLVPRQAPPSATSGGSHSGSLSGGPMLLFWGPLQGDSDGLSASLLGDDGAEETAPVTIPGAFLANNGAFTGSGFLIGTEAEIVGGGVYNAYVARIELDGQVAGTTTPAGTGPTAGNQAWVAWSGSQARAVYAMPTPTATDRGAVSANWMALDGTGQGTGPGVPLPPMSGGATTISAMAAGIGEDTAIALLGEQTPDIGRATRLDVMRVSGTGATVTTPFNVVADAEGIAAVALTTTGTDLIVAWIGGYSSASPRLGIARVKP